MSDYFKQNAVENSFNNSQSWVILSPIEQSIKRKIEAIGTPLRDWDIQINYGIKTGFNDAFIISGEKKDELIAADPKSAEIIRPILRGRDIRRYGINFADSWIIATFPSLNYDIEDYPAIKQHLLSFGKERLEQTGKSYIVDGKKVNARKKTNNKWFEMQDSISFSDDFSRQKIVWGEISDKPKFALDKHGDYFVEATTFMMTGTELPYLLTFLNSLLSEYYFSKLGTTTGVGTVRWKKFKLEEFPVPKPEEISSEIYNNLIAEFNQGNYYNIDKYIFEIFGFSEKEIAYIGDYNVKLSINDISSGDNE